MKLQCSMNPDLYNYYSTWLETGLDDLQSLFGAFPILSIYQTKIHLFY